MQTFNCLVGQKIATTSKWNFWHQLNMLCTFLLEIKADVLYDMFSNYTHNLKCEIWKRSKRL